ncbi:hypothetical protein SEA_ANGRYORCHARD_61 [Rhodococcus phage AngryOrchard]|uniref:Uncharacterized protein n=1 Tax=Rhodococcus phage AngryOrchard TaxID=1955425 RepID=A0A1S5VY04_9CAUD|nr:hypothetical protein SEA_ANGRYORCHARD_61 [Rhodococcus phage AngryOrchard]
MHYGFNEILETAEPIGDGYKKAVILLVEGDTAYPAISTKWVFAGSGEITYLIHPSGWHVTADDEIRKHYV